MIGLKPPGADERSVTIDAGTLTVLHSGRPGGTPLVLIHGGGTDASALSWYRLMEPLGADREVWAIDLPGFGGSIDCEPVGGPSAMAAVVAEVMAAVGLSSAIVFGVSMGGDVALTLALEHPGLVSGLVLIAPGGLVPLLRDPITQYWAWAASRLPDGILLPLGRLSNRFVRTALKAIVNDLSTLPPEVIEEFTRVARDPRGALGYTRYNQATLGRHGMLNDHTEDVHRVGVPTLIVHGERDPIVDPAGSRRAAALMPNARLVMIPDCGHWAQLEAHDRFLAEAQAFLAET